MDDVNFSNIRRSGFFETDDDDISSSSSTIEDTLDLAVRRPASTEHVHPLERLSGRWTFQSMPQDVNLTAYGKQFSGKCLSFLVTETDCGATAVVNATTSAPAKDLTNEETQDGGIPLSGADGKNYSSARSHPNTFAGQCVAYVGRVFSWDFYRTVCLFFRPIVTFRNRR